MSIGSQPLNPTCAISLTQVQTQEIALLSVQIPNKRSLFEVVFPENNVVDSQLSRSLTSNDGTNEAALDRMSIALIIRC